MTSPVEHIHTCYQYLTFCEIRDRWQEALIVNNTKLVYHAIRLWFKKQEEISGKSITEDMYSAGCVALVRAARMYDPLYGAKFSTYAMWSIKKEILRYLLLESKHYQNRLYSVKLTRVEATETDNRWGELVEKYKLISAIREHLSGTTLKVFELWVARTPYETIAKAIGKRLTTVRYYIRQIKQIAMENVA